jgi:hypothetical protein
MIPAATVAIKFVPSALMIRQRMRKNFARVRLNNGSLFQVATIT